MIEGIDVLLFVLDEVRLAVLEPALPRLGVRGADIDRDIFGEGTNELLNCSQNCSAGSSA